MIINPKRKYVFICVPKTGSTTLSKHFYKVDDLGVRKTWLKEKWHWPMRDIIRDFSKEFPLMDQYFKFAYHRNPWDRMISSWIEFTTDRGHLLTWSQPLKDQFKTFEDFVLNFEESVWCQHINFQPTSFYTHTRKGKSLVDHIAKYDDWHNETKYIFEKIGLRIEDMQQKRYRKTDRHVDYRKYYTNDKMIEVVKRYFNKDIDKFGDKF